eukprot:6197950-Pleurochrysis_carterae.AAC.5
MQLPRYQDLVNPLKFAKETVRLPLQSVQLLRSLESAVDSGGGRGGSGVLTTAASAGRRGRAVQAARCRRRRGGAPTIGRRDARRGRGEALAAC